MNLLQSYDFPYDSIDIENDRAIIDKAMEILADREKECLKAYFYEELSYEAIGKRIGRHREHVRQIIAKAERKLRHPTIKKIFYRMQKPWMIGRAEREEKYRLERVEERKAEYARFWQEALEIQQKQNWINSFPSIEVKTYVYAEPFPTPPRVVMEEGFMVDTNKISEVPPHFVKLKRYHDGTPYLSVDAGVGSISRDRDPATYDTWLEYLQTH